MGPLFCSRSSHDAEVQRRLLQPALHRVCPVLLLPLLEGLVIATFGFHHFAAIGVLVALGLARHALRGSGRLRGRVAAGFDGVKDRNDVFQADTVLLQQRLELALELDLPLQASNC